MEDAKTGLDEITRYLIDNDNEERCISHLQPKFISMWIKFKGNIQICSRWARASWKGGRSRQKVHWVLAKVTAFLQKEHLGMRNAKKNFFSTYLESAYSDEMTKDDWVSCFRRRGVYNGKLSSGISVSSESDSFNSAIFFTYRFINSGLQRILTLCDQKCCWLD